MKYLIRDKRHPDTPWFVNLSERGVVDWASRKVRAKRFDSAGDADAVAEQFSVGRVEVVEVTS